MHEWVLWSRAADYTLGRKLPIKSVDLLRRHLGVDQAIITTPFTPEAWAALQPSLGVVLYRDGQQQFSGLVGPLELTSDPDSGRAVIKAACDGDLVRLDTVPVFPDPLRAPADQTVNDYWSYTGIASSAMRQLISDQAGPTCRADRRVPGLVLGADPGVGLSRTWTGLFHGAGDRGVLDQLAAISVASGENLGVRTSTSVGALTVDIVHPRDLTDSVVFSVSLGNLAGVVYRLEPPKVTDALAHGQGDLHLRLRRYAATASSLALSWGRKIWANIDRRDTADVAELDKATADALGEGDATVSLAATLLDSQAATYGVDWDLGDAITLHVGVHGYPGAVAAVSDVVREVHIQVDDTGAEEIRPAVGSHDARAIQPEPAVQQLTRVSAGLAGLKAHK